MWLVSLILPAVITESEEWVGYVALILGWLGLIDAGDWWSFIGVLAWWANIFYLYSLKEYLDFEDLPIKAASYAVTLSLLSFLVNSFARGESGAYADIIAYCPGVLCWLFAIFSLAYVVFKESGKTMQAQLVYKLYGLGVLYLVQVLWMGIAGDDLDRKHVPFYAAKRGLICIEFLKPVINCSH